MAVAGIKMVPVVEVGGVNVVVGAEVHSGKSRKPGLIGSHRVVQIAQKGRGAIVVGNEVVVDSQGVSVVRVSGNQRVVHCDHTWSMLTGETGVGDLLCGEPACVAVLRVVGGGVAVV